MISQPTILAANIGMADTLILMVMALVVFGPRRLPTIGRQIGKLMYEFRKASNDFRFQMEEELRSSEEAERRKKEEAERAAAALLPGPTSDAPAATASADGAAETVPSPYPGEDHYPPVDLPAPAAEQAVAEIPEYITDAAQSQSTPESHQDHG